MIPVFVKRIWYFLPSEYFTIWSNNRNPYEPTLVFCIYFHKKKQGFCFGHVLLQSDDMPPAAISFTGWISPTRANWGNIGFKYIRHDTIARSRRGWTFTGRFSLPTGDGGEHAPKFNSEPGNPFSGEPAVKLQGCERTWNSNVFCGMFCVLVFFSMVNHQKMMFLTVKVAPCHPWQRWKSISLVIWKGRNNQRGGWLPSYSEKVGSIWNLEPFRTSMPPSSKTDSPSLWPTICAPTGGAMLAEICWQRLGRQQRVALLAKPTRVENTKPETPGPGLFWDPVPWNGWNRFT